MKQVAAGCLFFARPPEDALIAIRRRVLASCCAALSEKLATLGRRWVLVSCWGNLRRRPSWPAPRSAGKGFLFVLVDTLNPSSLDWALAHTTRYGDTDLFPTPFEFEAISHAWNWLQRDLAARDLATHTVGPFRRVLVPKPNGSFRLATKLDPLDSLLFAGMLYEVAETIEAARVPVERKIACSYRIEVAADGRLLREDSGWSDFQERSRELLSTGSYSHVVLADIGTFYNSIYHHRLDNALATAGVPEARRASIMGFLGQLTATQSTGIPVGSTGSVILSEVCMTDVDTMLLVKGYAHTRYVDDFRIFAHSRRAAVKAMHDLSEYLYTAHRLSLEPAKTTIVGADWFRAHELVDPEDKDEQATDAAIAALVQEARDIGVYAGDEDPPDEELVTEATRDALTELFAECGTGPFLQLGLARYLLRKAARLRTNVLVGLVFNNLVTLTPILREVALYLRSAMRRQFSQTHFDKLKEYLTDSAVADLPFVHIWSVEMMRTIPALRAEPESLILAEQLNHTIGLRAAAQQAQQLRRAEWVRARKETWRSQSDWDRRALIWAGATLPSDERHHWLAYIQGVTAGLDRAVAQKAAMTT